jgi:hypothetical protein
VAAVVDGLQQFQRFFLQESNASGMGYGLSLVGHVVVALLLMFGVFERIELIPVAAIPVEIVMEKPAQAARQDAPASSPAASAPAASASSEQPHPSGIPAVADADKRAKAPIAPLNVNGVDRPKQPGNDGKDLRSYWAGVPLPPGDTGLASGGRPAPSETTIIAPIGPAPRQMTVRELGEDELTALKEQKIECGAKAKLPTPTVVTRGQARVRGFASDGQALAIMRSNQTVLDRHVNPNYIRNLRLFVESLDGMRRFIVLLPSGLAVKVGDVIQYDQHHIDPSDPCQFIPNLAVGKL